MKRPGPFGRLIHAARYVASGTWSPQSIGELDEWMDSQLGGGHSMAGPSVSGSSAVTFAAFYSGVSQISQTIASCRTNVFRRYPDGMSYRWRIHPVYKLLVRRPNPYMDAFRWKERMQYHAIVWGNGYSFIVRDGSDRPAGLILMNPERMREEIEDDGTLVYIYRDLRNDEQRYNQSQIFHLAGFGFDGVSGYSLIRIHREAIGLGLSQQEFTSRFTNNGTHLGGLLLSKSKLSDEAQKRLKASFSQMYAGAGNAGKFAVLEEEMDYKPLGMPLEDAQFLESKIFQVQEIARILNISPYKLKDYSHATFSNIEHLGIEYATDTIRPWAERWESAIDTQLFNELEQDYAYAEFDLSAIQRGDFKTQNEGFSIARNGGWMNGNEIRQKQGLNPVPGRAGEAYWIPKNMDDANNPTEGGA